MEANLFDRLAVAAVTAKPITYRQLTLQRKVASYTSPYSGHIDALFS